MPKHINIKIIVLVKNCFRNLVYFIFFLTDIKIRKHKNRHFQISLTTRFYAHCGVRLCGVYPTEESNSMLYITPRSQTRRCASHRGVKLHGVLPTAESSSAVCIIPLSQVHQISQKTQLCASHFRSQA